MNKLLSCLPILCLWTIDMRTLSALIVNYLRKTLITLTRSRSWLNYCDALAESSQYNNTLNVPIQTAREAIWPVFTSVKAFMRDTQAILSKPSKTLMSLDLTMSMDSKHALTWSRSILILLAKWFIVRSLIRDTRQHRRVWIWLRIWSRSSRRPIWTQVS